MYPPARGSSPPSDTGYFSVEIIHFLCLLGFLWGIRTGHAFCVDPSGPIL